MRKLFAALMLFAAADFAAQQSLVANGGTAMGDLTGALTLP